MIWRKKFFPHDFLEIFRQNNFHILKSYGCELISRKFSSGGKFPAFPVPYCVVELMNAICINNIFCEFASNFFWLQASAVLSPLLDSQSESYGNLLSCTFGKKFRDGNGYTKEITKVLIWRNIFLMRVIFSIFHTVGLRIRFNGFYQMNKVFLI